MTAMRLDGRRKAAALLAAALFVYALGASSVRGESYAYVANSASGTVSIVDTQTDKVTSTFNVGEKPRALAASIDGARLYTAHQNGTVIERDLFTDKSVRLVVGRAAKAIHPSPDGKLLSIAIDGSDVVALVDMAALRVLKTIRISGKDAEHAVFSPDGRWIYADTEDGDAVDVIDVAKGAVIKSINVGHRARGIGFLPGGARAYAARDGEIVVIDASRHDVVARVKSAGALRDVAVHPDDKRVFVSAADAGAVRVLDAQANSIIASVDVGAGPSNMAFTADGNKLYVACSGTNEVSVIDTSTYKRIQGIPVGASPSAIVISERPTLPRDGD